MAGAVDLFSGANSIAGRNLFQVDKNPLNTLDMGVQDVIGQQALNTGNKITSALEALASSIMGITLQELSNIGMSIGDAIGTFFGNILKFLGNINPLSGLFKVEQAAENFMKEVLMLTAPFVALIQDVEAAARKAELAIANWVELLAAGAWNDIQAFITHLETLTPIQAILDALGWISTGAQNALTDLNNALHNIPGLNVIIADVTGAFHNLVGFLTNLTPAGLFTDLTKIEDTLGNALSGFLTNLNPNGVFADFTKIVDNAGNQLHAWLVNLNPLGVFTDFTKIVDTTGNQLHSFIQNLNPTGIFTDLTKIVDTAGNQLHSFLVNLNPTGVFTDLTKIVDTVGNNLFGYVQKLHPTLGTLSAAFLQDSSVINPNVIVMAGLKISDLFDSVTGAFKGAIETAVTLAGNFAGAIVSGATILGQQITSMFSSGLGHFIGTIDTSATIFTKTIGQLFNSGNGNFIGAIDSAATFLGTGLGTLLTNLNSSGQFNAAGLFGSLNTGLSFAGTALSTMLQHLQTGIYDASAGFANLGSSILANLQTGLYDASQGFANLGASMLRFIDPFAGTLSLSGLGSGTLPAAVSVPGTNIFGSVAASLISGAFSYLQIPSLPQAWFTSLGNTIHGSVITGAQSIPTTVVQHGANTTFVSTSVNTQSTSYVNLGGGDSIVIPQIGQSLQVQVSISCELYNDTAAGGARMSFQAIQGGSVVYSAADDHSVAILNGSSPSTPIACSWTSIIQLPLATSTTFQLMYVRSAGIVTSHAVFANRRISVLPV